MPATVCLVVAMALALLLFGTKTPQEPSHMGQTCELVEGLAMANQ